MTQARHNVDELLTTGQMNSVITPTTESLPTDDIEVQSEISKEDNNKEDYGVSEVIPEKNIETSSETETDEYGNEVEKEKLYTEEDVQNMIRKRLSRVTNRDQQPTQQQVQDATNNFNYDESSSDSWQQQLDGFVRQTVNKISQEQIDQQRRAQEKAVTQAFEDKFQTGMTKYPDFVQTIQDKPITDAMMHGIRGLDNPAAFLYAAAKMQSNELDRISKIIDPYQQVSEMGRLHERMKMRRNTSSNAAKPLKPGNSDIVDNTPYKQSIEDRITEHGKEKVRR